jgi:hypothetical protein
MATRRGWERLSTEGTREGGGHTDLTTEPPSRNHGFETADELR